MSLEKVTTLNGEHITPAYRGPRVSIMTEKDTHDAFFPPRRCRHDALSRRGITYAENLVVRTSTRSHLRHEGGSGIKRLRSVQSELLRIR